MHTPLFNKKMNDLSVATRQTKDYRECAVEIDNSNTNIINWLLLSFMLMALAFRANRLAKKQGLNATNDELSDQGEQSDQGQELDSLPEDILSTTFAKFFEVETPSPDEILATTNQDLFWEICSNEDAWTNVPKSKKITPLTDAEPSVSRCSII